MGHLLLMQFCLTGTSAARKAKQSALEVLRGHERAGAAAFRAAAGLGAGTLQQELQKTTKAARSAGMIMIITVMLEDGSKFKAVLY